MILRAHFDLRSRILGSFEAQPFPHFTDDTRAQSMAQRQRRRNFPSRNNRRARPRRSAWMRKLDRHIGTIRSRRRIGSARFTSRAAHRKTEAAPRAVLWIKSRIRYHLHDGRCLIDGRGEVLDAVENPILGLYAAGDAIGGLMGGYRGGYTGGLMQAVVTGILAGENAASHGRII